MSSQKKSSRLEGKDLITIGIYTVIYVVIVMLVAMLGFIPIFIPLMAVLCPLIGGIPYMLYVTKAKKFGMTAIMGFLIGLIMVFFGILLKLYRLPGFVHLVLILIKRRQVV